MAEEKADLKRLNAMAQCIADAQSFLNNENFWRSLNRRIVKIPNSPTKQSPKKKKRKKLQRRKESQNPNPRRLPRRRKT